jgi:hypothetical protein
MKRYELYGIAHPGRIHFPGMGEIVLSELSDQKLEELYNKGCPYVKPTPQHRQKLIPTEPSLEPKPLTKVKGGKKN